MKGKLVATGLALGLGLILGSCGQTSDFVADYWPHFAGGEPTGVPPRPGDPGYAQFIAHGQPTDPADTYAPNGPPAVTGSTVAAEPPLGSGQHPGPSPSAAPPAQRPAAADQAPAAVAGPPGPPDHNVIQGGLY